MRVLILATARSGSNWVYDSIVKYAAPEQLNQSKIIFNEPFSDGVGNCNLNWQNCMQQPQWVIKSLAHQHTLDKDKMTQQAIRASDRTVKLLRHPKSIVISTIAAQQADLWGDYSSHTCMQVTQDEIEHAVQGMLEDTKQLHTLPCDTKLYYEDLFSSYQIYNSIASHNQRTDTAIHNSKEFSKPNRIYLEDPDKVSADIDQCMNSMSNAHIRSYPRPFDIQRYCKS